MKNTDKLRKALDTIALKHAEGVVSNDLLIKACENYKNAIGFEDDYAYQMIVAKTCFDYINGVEQDPNLIKAVVPGQTKVVDQIMYVYSATAPGSKTPYAWHVVNTTQTGGMQVGRAVTDATKQTNKQAYINDLFPTDISSLKQIKALGGSTGAVLVEDANGNRYVKKSSSGMLSPEMVRNEYKANQVYDLLGVRVPDYELYEEPNGDVVLLSRFIPGFKPINKFSSEADRKKLAKNAIADVLLNNWDVFCNDNSNLDVAGRVVRVDNGGTFQFRAQGGKKTYDADVLKSYQGMVANNSSIYDLLTRDDIEEQIKDIVSKKDSVVAYLNASGETKTAQIIGKRIDNLQTILDYIDAQNPKPKVTKPRNLLPAAQMYREFTEDEIQEFWDNAPGKDYRKKIEDTNSTTGWTMLGEVLKARGFDARPRVVDDKEYWATIAKSKHPQIIRGVHDDDNNPLITKQYQKDHFKYNDIFYSGRYGIYGSGLYAHVNDGHKYGGTTNQNKNGYKSSTAYSNALDYARGGDDGVILMALEDDFKMVTLDDLVKEVQKDAKTAAAGGIDKKKVAKLTKREDELTKRLKDIDAEILNLTTNIEQTIYQQMNYDEIAVTDMFTTIDNTVWNKRNAEGELIFPKFDEIVTTSFVDWVKKNGGTATPRHGEIVFTLPHANEKFIIRKFNFDDEGAIRHRNALSPAYHFVAERFKNWFTANHINLVKDRVQEEIDASGDKVTKLEKEKRDKNKELMDVKDEKNTLLNPDPNADIYQAAVAYQHGVISNSEAMGVIAAIKGYDGIYQPNGNRTRNGFLVILNRSKVIVKA